MRYDNKKFVDTIILDSKDRLSSSTSSTNFVIDTPSQSVDSNLYHFRKFIIPLSFDNITTSNNTVEIDDVPVAVPIGQYSSATLAAELTAKLGGNYVVSVGNNGRITITNSVIFKWEPLNMGINLGFTESTYTGSVSYTAEHSPYLSTIEYFTLHSEFITTHSNNTHKHSDKRSECFALVPIKENIGSLLVHVPDEPLYIQLDQTNNISMDFKIRDDSGNLVDLQDKKITMVIERFIYKKK